jgi:SPP1 gp7 family putative phage head morphogenesis protein
MREWLADLDKATYARVRDSIRIGYTEGRTTQQIIRDLRGTAKLGFKDGIFEINRRHAETVVRTAISHTANTSRNALYSANTDVIAEVQWVSTLDGRTSAICQARDGKTWPVDSGPRPPAHPNCRSSMTPVVKSWRGLNQTGLDAETRASMDGQVAANLTYGGWLKRQPASVQNDILGKTKGKLFRRGGVPVDRFVDYQGHEYTLKELRKREASAFTAAGL